MKNILINTFVFILFLSFGLFAFVPEGKTDIAGDVDKATEGGVETLNKLKERAKTENLQESGDDSNTENLNNSLGEKADFPEEFKSNSLQNLELELRRLPYSSRGKRDPFKAFIQAPKETKQIPLSESTPPIKRYSLNQYRIVGIITYANSPKAMVVDPEQNTYYLGIDDEIGNKNGKIIEVRDNGLLVQEKRFFEDVFGNSKVEVKKSVLAFIEEDE